MVGTRAEPHVPGLGRVGRFLIAQHPDRLVGQVFGQVVTLFGTGRLLDETVVLDQVRIPLVGLPAEEAVEAVEALLQRPLRLAAATGHVLFGHIVVLADPERAVTVVLQHLSDGRALRRQTRRHPGKTVGALRNRTRAVHVLAAPGQKTGPGGRAQRRGVPLGVRQAVIGKALHDRHVDPATVGRPRGQTGVVVQHDQNVRRTLGCLLQFERFPVGCRVPDVEFDLAVESLVDSGAVSGRSVADGFLARPALGIAPGSQRSRRGGTHAGGHTAEDLAPREFAAGSGGLRCGRFSGVAVIHGQSPRRRR